MDKECRTKAPRGDHYPPPVAAHKSLVMMGYELEEDLESETVSLAALSCLSADVWVRGLRNAITTL